MGCFSNKLSGVCCIPLAGFVLVFSALLAAWGSWEIYAVVDINRYNWDFYSGMALAMCCLRTLAGLAGLLAALINVTGGLGILICFLKALLVLSAFTFAAQWIQWILWFCGVNTYKNLKWEPTEGEINYMIVFTVFYVTYFILSWWMISTTRSLKKVIDVGGTGWELMNYEEIKDEQKGKHYKDNDSV